MKLRVVRDVEISALEIGSLFCSMFESPYSPWARDTKMISCNTQREQGLVWYGTNAVFDDESLRFSITFYKKNDDSKTVTKEFTYADILKALKRMARDHAEHFNDLAKSNADALTGDCFGQMLCYREMIYG